MTWAPNPNSQARQAMLGGLQARLMNNNMTPEQWRGLLPGGGIQSPTGPQSQWNELNGRLIGDTYLPPDVSTVDVGNGWYEVHHGGGRVGTLRPGGNNGRFLNDTNWQLPQPQLPAMPQPGGGAAPQPQPQSQGFVSNGAYGNQAMQLAGLLAQPQQPQQPTGGLLGGPKRGYRIPGGK